MLIWAITATVLGVVLLIIFAAYRRQVKTTCRHLAFLQKNKTNLRLRTELPFKELDELAESINSILEESEKLNREAATGERNLKEAITNISHDIRTPLTSLNGYFQLLSKAETDEEREQYIAVIRGRIESLKNMLEELFTYTKLQNEGYELSLETIDFKKCVCDTMFSFYNEFQEKGISPEADVCDERVMITGNTEAVQRMVQNILKNVLEHGNGDVRIQLKLEKGQAVFLCENKVEHPETIDVSQVFSRFYKSDPARTHSSTGLGLAIAKGLAERMGGTMTAELREEWFCLTARFEVVIVQDRK